MQAVVRRIKFDFLTALVGGTAAGLAIFLVATQISPKLAVLATVGLGATAVILINPLWGYYLTALLIPVERFGRLTEDTSEFTVSIMRMVGLVTLGALLLHAAIRKWRVRFGVAFWLYSTYTLLAIVSLTYTTDFYGTVRACGQIVGNLLFFFLILNIVNDFKLARRGVILWLAATTVIALYTTFDWHFGKERIVESAIGAAGTRFQAVHLDSSEWEESLTGVWRAIGSTSHSAVYGINLILTLPFFAFFLSRGHLSRHWRIVLFLSLLVVLYNILLTNTRSVMLVAMLVLILSLVRRLLVVRFSAVLSALVLAVIALPFVNYPILQRVLELRNYTYRRSSTLRLRLSYWDAGLRVAENSWLFGIGVGNKNEIPRYLKHARAPEQTTVHNEYLQTFMELGIIGWLTHFAFVFLLLLYGILAVRILRSLNVEPEQQWFLTACQIAMIAVLVYGVQCDVFRFPLKGWWLVAGLTCILHEQAWLRLRESRRQPPQASGEGAAV